MSHNYLLELHELVSRKIKEAKELTCENEADAAYKNGRIAALEEFKAHIGGMYNHKLPKRLLKRLNENKAGGWFSA